MTPAAALAAPRRPARRSRGSAESGAHVSRSRWVYDTLRSQIVRGTLREGARLVELELASRLGVSRTPVRDALAQLARDGFLVHSRGLRRVELIVAPLDPGEVSELWSLVGGVEAAAVSRIDLLSPVARRELADTLESINAGLRELGRGGRTDPERYLELQSEFHETLVRVCGGERIKAAHGVIRPHVARYEIARARLSGKVSPDSVMEHEVIIKAIRRGVPGVASAAVLRHWINAAARTAAVIRKGKTGESAGTSRARRKRS